MKNKVLYIISLAVIIILLVTLIHMQSEFASGYFAKLLLGVAGVAFVSVIFQYLIILVNKKHRKGPVFFINASEDRPFIFQVRQLLEEQGCICYPTDDLILQNNSLDALAIQIQHSRLIVALLSEGCMNNPYISQALRLAKKKKIIALLLFTKDFGIQLPPIFRNTIPLQIDDDKRITPEYVSQIILAKLTQ